MMNRKLLYIGLSLFTLPGFAQQMSESDYIRNGNKLYADSLYEKAEIAYRKALDKNPKSVDAMYNLGNALFNQQKGEEAIKQYTAASQMETDPERLAQIYHNMGVLAYAAQQYPQSVEAYKQSLRNNPHDDETRYNLAMAMYMNKKQQQQQQQQQDQKQDEQKQDEQKQDQQQQDQQKKDQQKQDQQQQDQQQQDQQQKDQQQQDQQQQQAQKSDENISKENAEQMLNAIMQDEKDIQEKVKKMQKQQRGKKLEKDW